MSVVNNALTTNTKVEFEVGEPATFLYVSDRYPGQVAVIERFKSGERKGQIRRIKVTRTEYPEVHPNDPWYNLTDKGFRTTGGQRVRIGEADYYQDPSF